MHEVVQNKSQNIRESFRKQIRRKHIQQIFAMKRKVANDQINQQQQLQNIKSANLQQLFEAVKSMNELDVSLVNLGNYFFIEDSLSKFQNQKGRKNMHNICLQICNTIFNSILPYLNVQRDSMESENNRKNCLIIVSNMLAEASCPHSELIPIISEGINSIYPNISNTNSEEVCEIGWILVNILCRRLDLSFDSDLQKPIQQILSIAQQIILVQNLEMMSIVYKNLKIFFEYVDQFFNKNEQHMQIQHFKIHRLILLQNTVNFNLTIQYGTVLIPIIQFIHSNLLYADNCHEKLKEDICMKCFKILSCTSSDKIMIATLKLIKKLAVKRQIVITIIKDYFGILANCLMYMGVNIKIQTCRLLSYISIDQQLTTFMVQKKNLQQIMVEMIKNIRDSQTLQNLIILTSTILQQTYGKLGVHALKTIQQHLTHKTGTVGSQANRVVEQFHQTRFVH